MEPAIYARQLTKVFARRMGLAGRGGRQRPVLAVDRVDLAIEPGQICGLLGRNGAGKTTLMRMLCGLLVPSGGDATVGGFDVRREPALVRSVAGLAAGEERAFSWRLSARRNLLFFAELHGLRGKSARSRVDEVLALLRFEAAADRPVSGLSSGMRQRLALGRALIHRPRVLFLDEPTRGLDPQATGELLAFLAEELVARHGTTVLLSTHHMNEVARRCTTLAILHRQRIRAFGSLADLNAAMCLASSYEIRLAEPLAQELSGPWNMAGRVLSFDSRAASLHDVLNRLLGSGARIDSITTHHPTLDDLFRAYTTDAAAPHQP
jgi:ABC-2 type transport system ATP-binding protein